MGRMLSVVLAVVPFVLAAVLLALACFLDRGLADPGMSNYICAAFLCSAIGCVCVVLGQRR